VAGLSVSFILSNALGKAAEGTPAPLYTAGIASILLGLFCRTLPHTPPSARGRRVSFGSIAGIDALRELGSAPFFVFLASSFLICIPLSAYYNFTQLFLGAAGVTNIAATQTLGQMSEVGFMLLMPFFFARLGVKWMLVVGMLAWSTRYALFALGAPEQVQWMVILGIALHGICYDFFFVTGQIYVDKKSSPAVRGQAQGLLVLVTYGVGMLIGAQIAGRVYNSFLGEATALTPQQWQSFWWIPSGFALAVLVLFALIFRDRKVEKIRTI